MTHLDQYAGVSTATQQLMFQRSTPVRSTLYCGIDDGGGQQATFADMDARTVHNSCHVLGRQVSFCWLLWPNNRSRENMLVSSGLGQAAHFGDQLCSGPVVRAVFEVAWIVDVIYAVDKICGLMT